MREAAQSDVPEIKKLIIQNAIERGWTEYGPIDEKTVETMVQYYLRKKTGFVYVHETENSVDGFFIGYCAPWLLDLRTDSLHEMMSGGIGVEDMWQQFLLWGKQKKAFIAIKGCYDAFNGPRFRRE